MSNALFPYRFGVSGWDYKDWHGPLYPQRVARDFRALPWLARFLDFMEVNVSFYRVLAPSVSQRWVDETPDSFTFVVKAWQGWTHEGAPFTTPEVAAFRDFVDPIREPGRLEGVLVQFPPTFRDTALSRNRLTELAQTFEDLDLYLEVRHRSLYSRDFLQFVESLRLNFVNVDMPEVRGLPALTRINTGPTAFLRLHGRNHAGWSNTKATRDERYDYSYTSAETEALGSSLEVLARRVPKILIASNNHFRAQAVATVLQLKSQLLKTPVPGPASLLATYPQLEPYLKVLGDESTVDDDASHRP